MPSLIIVSILTFAFAYIFLAAPRRRTIPTYEEPVRLGARFWAIVIDWLLVAACLSGVMVFLSSASSALGLNIKGAFDITFVLSCYTAPIFMNWVAYRFDKQTPGQYIMQFRVIGIEGHRASFWRRILHLYALLVSVNEKDGVFLWERKSNTRAVSTRHPN